MLSSLKLMALFRRQMNNMLFPEVLPQRSQLLEQPILKRRVLRMHKRFDMFSLHPLFNRAVTQVPRY